MEPMNLFSNNLGNYPDTQPFPATPAKWIYRPIYCVNDRPVVQWTLPVSVTIGE